MKQEMLIHHGVVEDKVENRVLEGINKTKVLSKIYMEIYCCRGLLYTLLYTHLYTHKELPYKKKIPILDSGD